jgi:hypothetical protein
MCPIESCVSYQAVTVITAVLVQVMNVGIGNNPCYPYDMCMEAHSSANVDLVSWEQVSTGWLAGWLLSARLIDSLLYIIPTRLLQLLW